MEYVRLGSTGMRVSRLCLGWFFPVRKGQNAKGLSRKAIFADIDDSLSRRISNIRHPGRNC